MNDCHDIVRSIFRCALWVTVLALLCPLAPVRAEGEDEETIKLPLTFNKVWFREKKKKGLAKLKAFKHAGLLTVTEDGLDFVGGKNSYFFPLEDIEMLSVGKLGKDVNTDWVVLSLQQDGTTRIVGLRDGHAWGYGDETLTIYQRLREAFELLEAGPYSHPDGYRPYDQLRHQIVLVYPEDWTTFVMRSIFVSEGVAYGRVVFSPRELDSLGDEMKEERSLPSIELGDELAVILDRNKTTGGMSCETLKPKAREAILEQIARYPVIAEAAAVLAPPSAVDDTIAGCAALRISARVRDANGDEGIIDARVFANEGTLFTLGARVPPAHAAEAEKILDTMADSVLLPVAQRGDF